MSTSSTINPNPNEGVYKYTVVTSGRPTLDGLQHLHGDIPVPAVDYLRKNGQAEARVKRQMAKLSSSACGSGLQCSKGKDAKVASFKKPSTQPLDPTEMSDYSPRTTTFVNGRPAAVLSIKQQPLTPIALNLGTGPSHASPDSARVGGSNSSYDDQEDAASVDSAPGMRLMSARSKDTSSVLPDPVPPILTNRHVTPSRYPQEYPVASEENLDLYLEQFFPELQSLSDAELLRLMDPNPSVPALPARSSTLAILQEMLQTQGAYANSSSSLQQRNSSSSNPPSSNWSIASDDQHHSASWSDTPSHSWRSPCSPTSGPANWVSWQHAANPLSSRKRQRSHDSPDSLDWPTLSDQVPTLSDDLPPSKRPSLHRVRKQEPESPLPLYSVPSASSPHLPHDTRPNPFASVSKLALLQPMQPMHSVPVQAPARFPQRTLDLQSYYSTQTAGSQAPHARAQACRAQLATSGESMARGPAHSHQAPLEPASVLEQALRELRAKPEALVA